MTLAREFLSVVQILSVVLDTTTVPDKVVGTENTKFSDLYPPGSDCVVGRKGHINKKLHYSELGIIREDQKWTELA